MTLDIEYRTPSMTCYSVTLYHDEPGEAAANHTGYPEYFRTEGGAVNAAKRLIDDYWQSAQINRGTYVEADPPNHPAEFDLDIDYRTPIVTRGGVDR